MFSNILYPLKVMKYSKECGRLQYDTIKTLKYTHEYADGYNYVFLTTETHADRVLLKCYTGVAKL